MEMIKAAWVKLDGIKTYLGGIGLIMGGLNVLVAEAAAIENGADTFAFLTGIPTNPALAAISAGLMGIGLGHKAEKAKAAAAVINNVTIIKTKKGKAKK